MSLQMGFTKKLELRTEKVKSVDIHPSEPWVASALYNGSLTIYNYNTQSLVKKIEMSDVPLRCCKFVPRKQWIIAAGDKMCIWVYNYNSLEKVNVVEGHKDYVRYLDLHASMPYVISCSDDMTVVLWDIDKNWEKVAVFEGHSHYVMMAKWSPKDANIFATCSLDKTISFWRVSPESDKSQNKPYFTLTGHERGVNCIAFSSNLSCPYIISGSDDCTIRVWDYQTKLCLQVLKKHFKPVSCVLYHPRLPIILSTGEDGDFNVWHSNLYKIKRSVNYGYGQLWHVASNNTDTALASDSGTCVVELAGGKPLASMYGNKLLMVKSSDILTCNLSTLSHTQVDPLQPLNLNFRSIGSSEFFPQEVSYHPNGRFICLCGDSEYIIYTSQGMKSKTFGKASQFVWSFEGDYATYDGFEVSVYSEFALKEKLDVQQVHKLHGGRLLGISTDVELVFYTWSPCLPVKRLNLQVDDIYWHPNSNKLALCSQISTYLLTHDGHLTSGLNDEEELFHFEKELVERVTSGVWVDETFIFLTSSGHLSLYLSGNTETLAYLDKSLHLIGYLPETELVYLCDDSVYPHHIPYNYLQFHSTLEHFNKLSSECEDFEDDELRVVKEELKERLAKLDEKWKERASKFLQSFGHYELGLLCTENSDLKFELYLKLGNVNECLKLLETESKSESTCLDEMLKKKWKRLGNYCLSTSNVKVAKSCFKYSNDFQNLLVLHVLTGDVDGVLYVAKSSFENKLYNISFTAYYLLNDIERCVEILHKVNRHAEATFMARTYKPKLFPQSFQMWNNNLKNKNVKLIQPLIEQLQDDQEQVDDDRVEFPPASQYLHFKDLN